LLPILALLTDGLSATGGIAQYNRDLITALSRSACVAGIAVLSRHGRGNETLPAKVRQFAIRSGRLAWSANAMVVGIRHSPDVVLCGHLYAAPVAASLA